MIKKITLIILATIWISLSEFLRNNVLVKSMWVEHYRSMGLDFPSAPINGIMWGVWSLCLAVLIYYLLKKFTLLETVLLSWFAGFLMMWITIGNLNVLPYGTLLFAIPLSFLEVYVAALILSKK